MKIIFDTHGNEKQKECARAWSDNTITEITYGGSKGSAKSFTGCSLTFGTGLMYPETHFFIARKNLNDLRKFTIPSIYEVLEGWKVDSRYYRYNGQDNYFELYNKSKIFLLDAKYLPSDPMYYRFGSMQMTGGWIEEAGEFVVEAKNNLHASIGRWKNDVYNWSGTLLQTCNPAKNYLYRDVYKPAKEGTLPPWRKFIQALPSDNKRLPAGYLENLDKILTRNEKERLLKGNWEYDDNPNALCDYDSILGIFKNDHIKPEGKKYITADIARFGSDKAVIMVWDGWVVIEVVIFDKSATTQLQECIMALRTKHQIPKHDCIADEDGIGGGVVDNTGINGFINNSSPIDEPTIQGLERPNFQNLQAQCLFNLAKKVNNATLFFKAEISEKHKGEIIEELQTIESYKTDVDGKLKILPKEKVKDKIGRSPDWRDALMMRMWFDLKPANKAGRFNFGR